MDLQSRLNQSRPPHCRRGRRLLAGAGLALSASPQAAFAQAARGPTEVSVEELMKQGHLPDLIMGNADAPRSPSSNTPR